MFWSRKISKNYAVEVDILTKYASKGLALHFDCVLDTEGDHTPRGAVCLIVANFKVFEFGFYNVNHKEHEE